MEFLFDFIVIELVVACSEDLYHSVVHKLCQADPETG